MTVNLLNTQGTQLATTTTDAQGYYSFSDLDEMDYQIQLVLPNGYSLTQANQGDDQTLDSDIDPDTLLSQTITITQGMEHADLDIGLIELGSLSGTLYDDVNADGVENFTDQTISGVTVYLDTNDNGQLDWTDLNANEYWDEGEGERWTVSDYFGHYHFDNLQAGDYVVRQVTPDGYTQITPGQSHHLTNISVSATGEQGDDISFSSDVSGDGRYVTFASSATNLVDGDTNEAQDVFLWDRMTDTITRISVASDGTQGDADSYEPKISADGRYITYQSSATNLVDDDTNGFQDIFVYDTQTQQTKRVSELADGTQSNANSWDPDISSDGRYIVFRSGATRFDERTWYNVPVIYLYDQQTGNLELIDVHQTDDYRNHGISDVSISDDARYFTFVTNAPDIVDDDTNGYSDVFVYDRQSGTSTRVSSTTDGQDANDDSRFAQFSDNGQYVVFYSYADNLIAGQTNPSAAAYLYDLQSNQLQLISTQPDGTISSGGIPYDISDDGRFIALSSSHSELFEGAGSAYSNLVIIDTQTNERWHVNVSDDGQQANDFSYAPAISDDASIVSFQAPASNLVPNDTNGVMDLFVYKPDFGVHRVSLELGEYLVGVDFTYRGVGSVEGVIWEDLNGDGWMDDDEPVMAGVTVVVGDYTTVTDQDGHYFFEEVFADTYNMRVQLPDGYTYTQQHWNSYPHENVGSDVDPVFGWTPNFTVGIGEAQSNIDAGLIIESTISGTVWNDANKDGVQDDDEAGLAGMTVNLYDTYYGRLIQTTVTDDAGQYTFDRLSTNEYAIEIDLPENHLFTIQHATADPSVDSDVDRFTFAIDPFTLGAQENLTDLDAGMIILSDVGTLVGFHDLDELADGQFDGVLIEDQTYNNHRNRHITNAGDFNGDGFDDFLVSIADYYLGINSFAGKTYLVYGSDTLTADDYSLSHLDDEGFEGATFPGVNVLDNLKQEIAGVGDINGDGYDDLIISVLEHEPLGTGEGSYYLLYGSSEGLHGDIDLADIAAGTLSGAVFRGEEYNGYGYHQVAGVGDVNGDGLADFAIVSDGRFLDDNDGDVVYLIYGSASKFDGQIPLTDVGTQAVPGTQFRNAGSGMVAAAGDFNGDGLDDLLLSRERLIYLEDVHDVVLLYGQSGGFDSQVLINDLDASDLQYDVINDGSHFTMQVRSIGDLNGDGLDDLAIHISAYDNLSQASSPGVTYIIYGTTSGLNGDVQGPQLDQDQRVGAVIHGIEIGDRAGIGIISAGDFNGDGINDLLMKCYASGNASGYYMIYGVPGGLQGDVQLTGLFDGSLMGAMFKSNVTCTDAGDFNGDGFDDLLATWTSGPTLQGYTAVIYGHGRSISSYAWDDSDLDGIWDETENALPGMTVNLLDDQENIVATTVTDSSGMYSFTGMAAGDYRLQFVAANGLHLTLQDAGDDDTIDSDVDPLTGLTATFTMADMTIVNHLDAGFYANGSISGTVWDDSGYGNNGLLGENDLLLSGMTVELHDTDGNVLASTVTDAQGRYVFGQLNDGDYQIYFPLPEDREFLDTNIYSNQYDEIDSDIDQQTGYSHVISIVDGQQVDHVDVGLYPNGSARILVWLDANANGIFDDGETSMPDTRVELNRVDVSYYNIAKTSTSHYLTIYRLAQGQYELVITPPQGYMISAMNQGDVEAYDSDVDPLTGRSEVITLGIGQQLTDLGVAITPIPYGSITGTAFSELVQNGSYDLGTDTQLQGVTVYLDTNANNTLDWTDANSNGLWDEGEGERWTLTDQDGVYTFNNVLPGDYNVKQITPAHHQLTSPNEQDQLDLIHTYQGLLGNKASGVAQVSADGRFVVFQSDANNLLAGDDNDARDVFVFDNQTNTLQAVSLTPTGEFGNGDSYNPSVSDDGRYITYQSSADNLVEGDTNGYQDIFVYDRLNDTTTRVNVLLDGTQTNRQSHDGRISGDGRYIVFADTGNTLSDMSDYGSDKLYVYDQQTAELTYLNVALDDTQKNYGYGNPAISGDGRYVIFNSLASNLVADDTNEMADIFVYDRQTGLTQRVNVASDGTQANYHAYDPNISSDGRYVTFYSSADNLVDADTNGQADIFMHDMFTGDTTRISTATDGTQANGSSDSAVFSPDGQYVIYRSMARNLVDGDTNGKSDIFIYDLAQGTTQRLILDQQGNHHSYNPVISHGGQVIVFNSLASNLVDDDTNNQSDIFIYQLGQDAQIVTVGEFEDVIGIDFGYLPYSSITGLAWHDRNANGLQDENEPVMTGQTVTLLDDQGSVLQTTTTDDQGTYTFSDLYGDDYQIHVALAQGYRYTSQDMGDDALDSDVDAQAGNTAVIQLANGQHLADVDAGMTFVSIANAGDDYQIAESHSLTLDGSASVVYDNNVSYAWDLDNDGQFDDATGVAPTLTWEQLALLDLPTDGQQVTISLQVTTPAGTVEDDAQLQILDVLATPHTDGPYEVDYGLTVTLNGWSVDAIDEPSDHVWDLDGDGIYGETGEQAQRGDEVGLNPVFDSAGLEAGQDYTIYFRTISQANAQFGIATTIHVGEASSIGDLVWLDVNGNGQQDESEAGVNDITVNLLDANGNPLATTTTDPQGAYRFDNLVTGQYIVEFIKPEGYEWTLLNADIVSDALDSDAHRDTGRTAVIELGIADDHSNADAGLYRPVSINGTTWHDLDGDGVKQTGETALAGITVFLDDDNDQQLDWTDANSNQLWDEGEGERWTTSGTDGSYSFTNLIPGTYAVNQITPVGYEQVAAINSAYDGFDVSFVAQTSDGEFADTGSYNSQISGNGRYVVFETYSSNLDEGNLQNLPEVYVRDLYTNQIKRVSIGLDGQTATASSSSPSISDDGRYIAFTSYASNLTDDDTSGIGSVYVYDQFTDQMTLISRGIDGQPANDVSRSPQISGDGRFVTFSSVATNLVANDQGVSSDIFVYDMQTGVTQMVSVSSEGEQGNFASSNPGISDDGRYVIFSSFANNLTDDEDNTNDDVFVHDRLTGQTRRLSRTNTLMSSNGWSLDPVISGNGRYAIFISNRTNLVDNDNNEISDVFIYDLQTDQIKMLTVNGVQGNSYPYGRMAISDNGQFIAFTSWSNNYFDWDVNLDEDLFVYDQFTDQLQSMSFNYQGEHLVGQFTELSISDDGRFITYTGNMDGVVPGDDSTASDVYLVDRYSANQSVTLASGQTANDINFGNFSPVISDQVWFDENGNGIQDDGESGVQGVVVNLLDDQETIVTTTITDADGYYLFRGLFAGDYIVEFELPADYVFTQSNAGSDDTRDSDADVRTGRSDLITLGDAEVLAHVDAGMMPAFELADEHLFYNATVFDNNGATVDANDNQAIDHNIQSLQPGQTATSVNFTSASDGITGIMIDGPNLHIPGISADDFTFKVGNVDDTGQWTDAPAPSQVLALPGEGVDGTDRIVITFEPGSIVDQWLQITVRFDGQVNVAQDEVFYFGSCTGDATGDGLVDLADVFAIWNNRLNPSHDDQADAGLTYDINKDGWVTIADVFAAWNFRKGYSQTAGLHMIQTPSSQLMQAPNSASQLAMALATMQGRYSLSVVDDESAPAIQLSEVDLTDYL